MRSRCTLLGALFLLAALPRPLPAEILYDFEHATDGWEQEAANPSRVTCTGERCHNGFMALAVTHPFGPGNETLQLRVKQDPPLDLSRTKNFGGFSAWVYLPKKAVWTVRMFTRSGEAWMWSAGEPLVVHKKGWVQVHLAVGTIFNPAQIQDFGVQVSLPDRALTATLYLDCVEQVGP